MNSHDFSEISERYKETSVVQVSAADILFKLLDIKPGENILDAGCGTGNLTKRLFYMSGGYVAGIDPSEGMIKESKNNFGGEIDFLNVSSEDISFENKFDVIFCNSAFQWFRDADKSVSNFYRALKQGGRIGIQAPAKKMYSPNFVKAVSAVSTHKNTRDIFKNFKSPWLMLETAGEYKAKFEQNGFEVPFSEIQTIEKYYTPAEVYEIFASGAIAGYLNQAYYDCRISAQYVDDFKTIIKEEFNRQADSGGKVPLVFNRIFLIGIKK